MKLKFKKREFNSYIGQIKLGSRKLILFYVSGVEGLLNPDGRRYWRGEGGQSVLYEIFNTIVNSISIK